MNLSIEQTELLINLIRTEIGYWSAPEHEEVADEFEVLKKTFEKSLAGKIQYQKRMGEAKQELDELPSFMKSKENVIQFDKSFRSKS